MKNNNFHQNEQGSAILIVLGILTLVLVLALVFVATSRNARTVAMANADNVQAGLLAESAANRAEAMAFYIQNITANIPDNSTISDLKYDYQPFVGNFFTTNADDLSALVQTESSRYLLVQHTTLKPAGAEDPPKALQSLIYTHDENNKLSATDPLLPYNLINGTKYGKFLNAAVRTRNPSPTPPVSGKFQKNLTQQSSQLNYRNILDSEGHVQSRYAFLLFSEGSKFNVNKMALASTSSGGLPYVPVVIDGKLDVSNSPGYNLESNGENSFAIAGYTYDNITGEINGLQDSGKYDEEKTVQYGLHPQELRITSKVSDIYEKLKLFDDNSVYSPKWFNYDHLLKNAWSGEKNDWIEPMLHYWHLYGLYSGADDREVLFHGKDAEINATDPAEYCSTHSPKINLAFPRGKKWNTISSELNGDSYLTAAPLKGVDDYLTDEFENIFGQALHDDTNSDELFKNDAGTEDITSQVFANLVDFCDEDDAVTYEATVGTGVGTQRLKFDTNGNDISDVDIKLCGNEKTPAVIGVGLELTNCNRTATNSGSYPSTGTWSVTGSGTTSYRLRVVLQNYFNDPVDLPAKVRVVIKGKINVWYAGCYNNGGANVYQFHGCTHSVDLPSGYSPLHTTPATFDFSEDAKSFVIDKTFMPTGSPLAAREVDDTTIYDDTGTFELNLASASSVPGKLERAGVWLQVTDVLVMTADGADKLMDLTYAEGDNHTILWTKNAVRIVMPWTSYRPIAWAVAQDPRCNHKDWQWFDALEPAGYNWTADATVGIANSTAFGMQDKLRKAALTLIQNTCINGNLSTAKDLEPLLDFTTGATGTGVVQTSKTFSTAFIPNAPITSLWQLGAVNRGAVAQTINLKKYGGPKGTLKYEDGDAWLLDYFKLNELASDASFPGKFNPNCFTADSYRYLLANIPANPDPNDTAVYQPGRLDLDDIRRNAFYDWFIETSDPADPAGKQPLILEGQLFRFKDALNYEYHDDNTAEIEQLMDDQAAAQSWSPVEAFFNFVEIVDTPKYQVKTGVDTYGYPKPAGSAVGANDRMAESLIGCSAGLLSTRYEYFTIFAIGQSLKYLGQRHTTGVDDYLPVNPEGNSEAQKAFKAQLVNPIKINAKAGGTAAEREEGWYSILATQMRLMTIERDCWFNTMRVMRTQLY